MCEANKRVLSKEATTLHPALVTFILDNGFLILENWNDLSGVGLLGIIAPPMESSPEERYGEGLRGNPFPPMLIPLMGDPESEVEDDMWGNC